MGLQNRVKSLQGLNHRFIDVADQGVSTAFVKYPNAHIQIALFQLSSGSVYRDHFNAAGIDPCNGAVKTAVGEDHNGMGR